jgi:hypothetical protein
MGTPLSYVFVPSPRFTAHVADRILGGACRAGTLLPLLSATSRGQRRAGLVDVSFETVLWLQDRFTGLEIDLQDAAEIERDLTYDHEDRRAVRLDPD